eukprot:2008132-Rhodomonas_salina.1
MEAVQLFSEAVARNVSAGTLPLPFSAFRGDVCGECGAGRRVYRWALLGGCQEYLLICVSKTLVHSRHLPLAPFCGFRSRAQGSGFVCMVFETSPFTLHPSPFTLQGPAGFSLDSGKTLTGMRAKQVGSAHKEAETVESRRNDVAHAHHPLQPDPGTMTSRFKPLISRTNCYQREGVLNWGIMDRGVWCYQNYTPPESDYDCPLYKTNGLLHYAPTPSLVLCSAMRLRLH